MINAANQQTIDPTTRVLYRPILCAQRNYPTAFQALIIHRTFYDTVNCEGSPAITFLGDPGLTWKFLYSLADRQQFKQIGDTQVRYYPTLTKIVYDPRTWIRKMLNNGQVCYRTTWQFTGSPLYPMEVLIKDPRFADRKLAMPAVVKELSDTFTIGTEADPVDDYCCPANAC